MKTVRDRHTDLYKIPTYREFFLVGIIETLKVIQSILAQNMPAERYNGLINLCFVLYYPNVTSEEIESALVSKWKFWGSYLLGLILQMVIFLGLFVRNWDETHAHRYPRSKCVQITLSASNFI